MAVYTEVSDEELLAFLARYELGALLSCKGIAEGVENSNFFLHLESGYYILTLYEKRVAESDLPFFLSLMEHLSAQGVSCPLPVKDREGRALGRLVGRPAAIVTFLEGYAVHHPDARHCEALGGAMAKLHLAGAEFGMSRANALSVDGWRALFAAHAHEADGVEPGMAALIEAELAALAESWPRDLPRGVIHADLFPDNVFFLGERVSGIIDFYFACCDAFVYDLAISLNAWCFDDEWRYVPAKGQALIEAYHCLRPLEARELSALPMLARGAALRFLLTRFVDALSVPAGALVRPKDPREYLAKLKFHRKITNVRDYGLDM